MKGEEGKDGRGGGRRMEEEGGEGRWGICGAGMKGKKRDKNKEVYGRRRKGSKEDGKKGV